MVHILIIGAGNLGTSLAQVLSKSVAQPSVSLWDRDPEKLSVHKPIELLVPQAEIICYAVNSWHIHEVIEANRSLYGSNTVHVFLSKGIEATTGLFMDAYAEKVLPSGNPYLLCSGPMLAGELSQDRGGAAVIAGRDPQVGGQFSSLFAQTQLYTAFSRDVRGVAVAGVLKNVYAILLGAAAELDLSSNMTGVLVSRIIGEMRSLIVTCGGEAETVYGYAGVADLIATGFNVTSNNHTYGRHLVNQGKLLQTSEGSAAVPVLVQRLGEQLSSYPLLATLSQMLSNRDSAVATFTGALQS